MRLRSLSLITLAALTSFACTKARDQGPTSTTADEIVDVPQTDVERQSIGYTWLYAHANWAESLHQKASGESLEVSRSYWMYWQWFDQIAVGTAAQIATGGNWETANAIVRKYGLVRESSFTASDSPTQLAARQAAALSIINDSLNGGALGTLAARHDQALVRRELDRAWALTPTVTTMLDRVFGADGSRTFLPMDAPADPTGTAIQRAEEFDVAYSVSPGALPVHRKLAQAVVDWQSVYYAPSDHRAFQLRVQRALADSQPVIITWFVDFNALEARSGSLLGSFNLATLDQLGPGIQGGHSTVLQTYQAKLEDGRILQAGNQLDPTNNADKTLLDSALAPSTQLEFFRVQNMWGSAHPARAFAPGMPDYHDLYLDYLDGPVKECVVRDGVTDTTSCPTMTTPLQNVVLPPGY